MKLLHCFTLGSLNTLFSEVMVGNYMTCARKQRSMSNMSFRLLSVYLKFRERFRKPEEFLRKIGLKEEHKVLDYGCGAGSYSIPAAKIVGTSGKIYALDIHPLAIEQVQKRARKEEITNLETIQSGLETGLEDNNLDYVLLLDVFSWVKRKEDLLRELHRILKPSGKLILMVDHMPPEKCRELVDEFGLFILQNEEENLFEYQKA
jgi:ubiquinone/menaquinone biosynthesis C-methylase UbiE